MNDQAQNRAKRQHLNMSPEGSNVTFQAYRHLKHLLLMWAMGTGKNREGDPQHHLNISYKDVGNVSASREAVQVNSYQPSMSLNTIPKHNSFPSHLLLLEAAIQKRYMPFPSLQRTFQNIGEAISKNHVKNVIDVHISALNG